MATQVEHPFAPGDLVALPEAHLHAWERVGIVVEVHDFGPGEPVYYDVKTPGRAPHPYTTDEIHAATDEDKAAHHPSWLRALVEDYEWRQLDAARNAAREA
jgi:hypothetical protein